MADDVSLEFIGRSLRDLHDELRAMRAEQRDVRTIVLQSIDQVRRVRDDLELMIRSETLGRSAHYETLFDRALGDLRDRVAALETADR